jgi:16S rRNA (guanine(966)-N(2))-methyltransferase RsmD
MKVISGNLKGRYIKGFKLSNTRPTMDRAKESIFSIIQDYIEGSICLDLFAGSGSLGIEAISRGSKLVYFIIF